MTIPNWGNPQPIPRRPSGSGKHKSGLALIRSLNRKYELQLFLEFCLLYQTIPVRCQFDDYIQSEHVLRPGISRTMTKLTNLPRELREEIWSYLCQQEAPRFPSHFYSLLWVCKTFSLELAPYLYATTVVHLLSPQRILRWVSAIGSYNSSCIRSLVIKFSSLESGSEPKTDRDHWHASLFALCSLETLVYHYEPSRHYSQQGSGLEEDHPYGTPKYERLLEREGIRGLDRRPRKGSYDYDVLESLPASHSRPITHVVMAIDEPMPEINMMSFTKLLSLDMKVSLTQSITRLTSQFFADHGLELVRTYTMIEDPQQQSVALTYRKQPPRDQVESPNLQLIFSKLPRLLYLRLGCRNVDSSFLTIVPVDVQTLDVSFRDLDPERVSRNLRIMRERCKRLFTLAIVVSPLHDIVEMPDGGRRIDQQSKDEDGVIEWEPFWDALRYIQGTSVNVWEGEGPRFKRAVLQWRENPNITR